MLRDIAKQRVRALEGALRFPLTPSTCVPATPRSVASAISKALRSASAGTCSRRVKPCSVSVTHSAALRCSSAPSSRLDVIGQCGHRLSATFEVHRELRASHRGACGTFPLGARRPTLRWSCARDDGAVRSYSTWRKSACLNEYGRSCVSLSLSGGTRSPQPQAARRRAPRTFGWSTQYRAPGHRRLSVSSKIDAANGRCGKQRALLAAQPGRCNDR
jgi:hypothetical protein